MQDRDQALLSIERSILMLTILKSTMEEIQNDLSAMNQELEKVVDGWEEE